MKYEIEIKEMKLVDNPNGSNRQGWGDETIFLEKPTEAFEYAYGWYVNGELVAIYCYSCPYLVYKSKSKDKNIIVNRWYKTSLEIDVSLIVDEYVKIQYYIHNRYGEKVIDDLRISQ